MQVPSLAQDSLDAVVADTEEKKKWYLKNTAYIRQEMNDRFA